MAGFDIRVTQKDNLTCSTESYFGGAAKTTICRDKGKEVSKDTALFGVPWSSITTKHDENGHYEKKFKGIGFGFPSTVKTTGDKSMKPNGSTDEDIFGKTTYDAHGVKKAESGLAYVIGEIMTPELYKRF